MVAVVTPRDAEDVQVGEGALRILIVDDEPLARARLRRQLTQIAPHYALAEAAEGCAALELAQSWRADIVLLDVRMPGVGGLDVAQRLRRLQPPPAVIFTTAYSDYALAAFETYASGYLLKPVRRDKLTQALDAASSHTRAQRPRRSSTRTHFCVTTGARTQLIALEDILYLRAEHDYVRIVHRSGEAVFSESLQSLQEEFSERFVRIHRATLVATAQLLGLARRDRDHYEVQLRDSPERLAVSRRHLAPLRRLLAEELTYR